MDLISIILYILFFGVSGVFALVSLLAIFVVLKYGNNLLVAILFSCIYAGVFFFGFISGLTLLP